MHSYSHATKYYTCTSHKNILHKCLDFFAKNRVMSLGLLHNLFHFITDWRKCLSVCKQ